MSEPCATKAAAGEGRALYSVGITQEETGQQFLKTLRPITLINWFITTEEVANMVV